MLSKLNLTVIRECDIITLSKLNMEGDEAMNEKSMKKLKEYAKESKDLYLQYSVSEKNILNKAWIDKTKFKPKTHPWAPGV